MPGTMTIGGAAALLGAVTLGSVAGATIPTAIRMPFGPDWRETYGIRADPDGPDYYLEPGPQDLSPALGGGMPYWMTATSRQERAADQWSYWRDIARPAEISYAADYATPAGDADLAYAADQAPDETAQAPLPAEPEPVASASPEPPELQAAAAAATAQSVEQAETLPAAP